MANLDRPIGLYPIRTFSGARFPVKDFPIDSSNGDDMFVGDVVIAEADGFIGRMVTDSGDAVLGVIVELKDTNGVSIGHPNSAVSTKYLPSSTAGIASIALAMPDAVFGVQSDSGTNVPETARFSQANILGTAGDTVTARSRMELDASDINTGSQVKIIDKVDEPGNDWDDANVELEVVFQESYWFDATAAVTS